MPLTQSMIVVCEIFHSHKLQGGTAFNLAVENGEVFDKGSVDLMTPSHLTTVWKTEAR